MDEQKESVQRTEGSDSPRNPYGYNERNIHSETTEIGEFTDTLNSDRVKLESSFFNVKHRWQSGTDGKADVRRTTTDINNFGVSIISLTNDNSVLIYHDGRIYKPVNSYWIENLADDLMRAVVPSYMPSALALVDFSTHPIGNYIIDNWQTLSDARNIITYCRASQLGKVADLLSRYPFAFRNYRITRQQHLTAFGAPSEGDSMLIYNGMFCHYECNDGMMEVLESGVLDECDEPTTADSCRVAGLDNSSAFFQFISGAMRVLFCMGESPFEFYVCDVLLDATPVPFGLCKAHPESDIRITDVLMPAFQPIPCKRSADLVLEESDELFVGYDGDMRPLDLRRRFTHQPHHVTVTIDVDERLHATVVVCDTDTGEEQTADYLYLRRA